MMKKLYLMSSLYLALQTLCVVAYEPIFTSLKEITRYAQSTEEDPPMDNTILADPDYSRFLKKKGHGFFSKMLSKIGMTSWPAWHIEGFNDLLLKVIEYRENEGYSGRFISKVSPEPGTVFVLWGDVQGAFHSLVRVLNELHSWDIISNDLTIVKPNYYFIFNGNLINRSAYTLETLTIVLQLMNKNRDKIFYLRGNHEDRGYWRNFSLKRDLVIRASALSSDDIPLAKEIDRFFDTLPLALYITERDQQDNLDLIRVSHGGRNDLEINENSLSLFFATNDIRNDEIFKLHNKQESAEKSVNIKAIIRGGHNPNSYRPTLGLVQLEADKGSTAWGVLSSPTESYRRLLDFYYDAFSIIEMGKTLARSTITLFNQDVRESLGFKKIATYNIVSGLKAVDEQYAKTKEDVPALKKRVEKLQKELEHVQLTCQETDGAIIKQESGLDKDKAAIVVAVDIDLTETMQAIGNNVLEGIKVVFDEVNQDGGINDHQLQYVVYDHGYAPEKARENVTSFLQSHVSGLFLSPTGTDAIMSYLDLIEQEKILVLFPVTGSPLIRNAGLKNIVSFRPSYVAELDVMVQHIAKQQPIEKIAVVYQEDDIAKVCVEHLEQLLKQHKAAELIKIPCDKDGLHFMDQIKQIKDEDPKQICFLVIPLIAQKIIQALGADFLRKKYLFGWSDLSQQLFKRFVKDKGIEFLFISVVPNVNDMHIPLVRDFQRAVNNYNVRSGQFTLEGYINALIFMQLLKQVTGPVTQSSLIQEAERISDMDFKGITLHFDSVTRQLSHALWLDTGAQQWIKVEINDQ